MSSVPNFRFSGALCWIDSVSGRESFLPLSSLVSQTEMWKILLLDQKKKKTGRGGRKAVLLGHLSRYSVWGEGIGAYVFSKRNNLHEPAYPLNSLSSIWDTGTSARQIIDWVGGTQTRPLDNFSSGWARSKELVHRPDVCTQLEKAAWHYQQSIRPGRILLL